MSTRERLQRDRATPEMNCWDDIRRFNVTRKGAARSLWDYIALCSQTHCNSSSFFCYTNTNKNLYSSKFVNKTRQRRWKDRGAGIKATVGWGVCDSAAAHGGSTVSFMVALCNRETIYIFILWLLSFFLSFMVALWNRETIYIFSSCFFLLLSFFFFLA